LDVGIRGSNKNEPDLINYYGWFELVCFGL